jgi:RNA polymerase sigma-70 factor, ECF subfamily
MLPEGFHELVHRARQGEPDAVEQLLQLIRPWLDGLARPWTDAPDLAQEAWLRTWQKLDQFQGGPDDAQTLERFRAWLRRIVERIGLNTLRARQADRRQPPGPVQSLDQLGREPSGFPQRIEPVSPASTPPALAEQEERIRLVRTALQKLPDEEDRDILRLRFIEGQSLRQIAQKLKRNHETVRQRFHAALRQLELELKGLQ